MGNRFLRMGGLWVIGQIMLMTLAALSGVLFPGKRESHAMTIAGGLLMGAGGVVAIAGVAALKEKLTPFPAPKSQSDLVQTGVYRFVRHPLYSSIIVTSFGWAVFRESWPVLAVSFVMIWFFSAKVRIEERWLRESFPEYSAYEQRVARFVPWIY